MFVLISRSHSIFIKHLCVYQRFLFLHLLTRIMQCKNSASIIINNVLTQYFEFASTTTARATIIQFHIEHHYSIRIVTTNLKTFRTVHFKLNSSPSELEHKHTYQVIFNQTRLKEEGQDFRFFYVHHSSFSQYISPSIQFIGVVTICTLY